MTITTTPATTPQGERLEIYRLGIAGPLLLVLGIICLLASIGGFFLAREQAAFSWLFAFTYCFTLCAGALFWVLLHHVVNASWTVVVRRVLENVAALFPYLAILFLPIAIFGTEIYTWMSILPGQDVLLDHKAGYLNRWPFGEGTPFWGWYPRAVYLFVFFCAAALFFKRNSVAQDADGDPRLSLKMRYASNWMVPLFAGSFTLGVVDWLMSLDFKWFSTMWGVYLFAGSALSSMALCILISNGLRAAGYLKGIMSFEHNHIMGKLLFAFTVFWAYISFSQYFLIYYGNIPEETWWYVHRNTGSWNSLAIGLVLGHFIAPFLMLLTQPAKQTASRLCFVAGWILVMHAVDIYWIILPQKQVNAGLVTGFAPHLLDLACLLGFIGVLGSLFLRGLGQASLYPCRDPRLAESIHLKN